MTDSFVAVLPSVFPPWTERCIRSMSPRFEAGLWHVDNTRQNRGVPASWNVGVDACIEQQAEWLIILSASIRFGDPGGDDVLDTLEHFSDDTIAFEAAHGIGWHLIGFRRRTLERVGRFDENFYPGYFEDLDYARRIHLAYGRHDPPWWPKVTFDVASAGNAHGINLGGVQGRPDELIDYYLRKWGGLTGKETHPCPFGNQEIGWWPPREPDAV